MSEFTDRGGRAARRLHRLAVAPLLALALPTACLGCGALLGRRQHLGACLACWTRLSPIDWPCPTCGLPRTVGTDLVGPVGGRCATCLFAERAVRRVVAAVAYDDHARRFLLRAKFGGRRELFRPLARQLVRVVRANDLATGCVAIVPVPSHPLVSLRRGYSPGLELARLSAPDLGLPIVRAVRIRWRARLAAKRLGARARRDARGVFRTSRRVVDGPVLLVDDVLTTGATVEACARVLVEAGATEVRVAVWARTPRGHPV